MSILDEAVIRKLLTQREYDVHTLLRKLGSQQGSLEKVAEKLGITRERTRIARDTGNNKIKLYESQHSAALTRPKTTTTLQETFDKTRGHR